MSHIVIDTETTGMSYGEGDRIVELAAVWGDSRFHTLVNPGRPIPPQAMAVHHIRDRDVATAAPIETAIAALLALHGPLPPFIVAHNAAYDRQFLDPALSGWTGRWICTYRCSLHIWPHAPSHSNQALRYWLDLELSLPSDLYPHRALYDAIVTKGILDRMLQEHSLDDLHDLTGRPVLLERVGFGKHRGQEWRNVPADYLQWVLRQQDMDADTRHTAAHWLRPQGRLI